MTRPWLGGVVGTLGIIAVWWLLAATLFASNGAVPTPPAVVASVVEDGWGFYSVHLSATVSEAAQGFLWGNGLAIGLALLVVLLPWLESVVVNIAVISYCLPILAIGPIVTVVFGGRTPMIVLAAIFCFFTTVIGTLLGLNSADRTSLDVVTVYGGGRWSRLRHVQLISAVPAVLAALRIAAPSALLGAIIGEYLGGVDTGLGVAMTISQQQYLVSRTWGLALVSGLVAGLAYVAIGLLSRVAAPWARGGATDVALA